jgi:hypothetical protein
MHAIIFILIIVVFLVPGTHDARITSRISAAPSERYAEDFTTYTYKQTTEDIEWDTAHSALRLTRYDDIGQYHPVIAAYQDESSIMAWTDYRNGHADIYAQRLDGYGNKLWEVDVRVNSDTNRLDQSQPSIAIDENGYALIVWLETDTAYSAGNIYVQKLDITGNHLWSQDKPVNATGGSARDDLSMDYANGIILVAWADRNLTSGDIAAQKLDVNGHRLWGNDVHVSADGGNAFQWDPAVTINDSGEIMLAWSDNRGANVDIYAQSLDASGTRRWSSDLQVNSDSVSARHDQPALVMDATGHTLIAWCDQRDGKNIYAQRLNLSGSKTWTTDVRMNMQRGAVVTYDSPVVALNSDQHILLAWTEFHDEKYQFYTQTFDTAPGGNLRTGATGSAYGGTGRTG